MGSYPWSCRCWCGMCLAGSIVWWWWCSAGSCNVTNNAEHSLTFQTMYKVGSYPSCPGSLCSHSIVRHLKMPYSYNVRGMRHAMTLQHSVSAGRRLRPTDDES
jgi:hypothetical protein